MKDALTPPTETLLEARNLTKSFKGFVAVNGINLKIRSGEIHALIGPNGAGKTTVFNLLTKFLTPTEGEIIYRGEHITNDPPQMVAQRGIVRSFQISSVYLNLNVLDNVRLALQRPLVSARRFWQTGSSVAHLDAVAADVLKLVDLDGVATQRAGDLPYGRKRALELATTVAADPVLMLLDEPTQGLGFEEVDRITALIKKLAQNRTVVLVEHNMTMVASIADRISVLRYGEIIAEGTYEDVSSHPEVVEAYLGSKHRKRVLS
jgi:branched-chain amino acid transport system ATP-binding protein